MNTIPIEFDVFLSYSWANKSIVMPLHAFLVSRGYKVWIDETEITAGIFLIEGLELGIRSSRMLMCCLSDSYAKSRNCMNELLFAAQLNKLIIPVMLFEMNFQDFPTLQLLFGHVAAVKLYEDKVLSTFSMPLKMLTNSIDRELKRAELEERERMKTQAPMQAQNQSQLNISPGRQFEVPKARQRTPRHIENDVARLQANVESANNNSHEGNLKDMPFSMKRSAKERVTSPVKQNTATPLVSVKFSINEGSN